MFVGHKQCWRSQLISRVYSKVRGSVSVLDAIVSGISNAAVPDAAEDVRHATYLSFPAACRGRMRLMTIRGV